MPTETSSAAFELTQRLGETPTTEIWSAVQTALGRPVIIHLLKPAAAANTVERDHFLATARCLAKSKCENITSVFDIATAENQPYAVFEQLDGPRLADLLVQHGSLPLAQILPIAQAVVNALSVLWDRFHLLHRNITSRTVQFDSRGVAKLCDFSLAVTPEATAEIERAEEGEIIGSPCYLAPEQITGGVPVSCQTDMYALGALLYELATGCAPFADKDPLVTLNRHLTEHLTPPDLLKPTVTPDFSRLVARLMMKAPADRYPDWPTVQADLDTLAAGRPLPVFVEPAPASSIQIALIGTHRPATTRKVRRSLKLNKCELSPDKPATNRLAHENASEIHHDRRVISYSLMGLWFATLFTCRAILPEWMSRHEVPTLHEIKATIQESLPPVQPRELRGRPETPASEPAIPPPSQLNEVLTRPASPAPAEHAATMPALPAALTEALRAGDLAAARNAVAATGAFENKAAISSLLARAPTPAALLTEGLRPLIGHTTELPIMGKLRRCTPRLLAADAVEVECNGRTIRVPFDKFDPETRYALVPKPHDEATALSYCLLLLRSNRKPEVAEFAQLCPTFRDMLTEAAR